MSTGTENLVNSPTHYSKNGVAVGGLRFDPICYTERLPHREAAALEYILRAGTKVYEGKTAEESRNIDFEKARYYLIRRALYPIEFGVNEAAVQILVHHAQSPNHEMLWRAYHNDDEVCWQFAEELYSRPLEVTDPQDKLDLFFSNLIIEIADALGESLSQIFEGETHEQRGNQ